MNRTLVSIVIPCYNQGKFLIECINSVKNQSYTNIEIIVVNDGSDDEYTLHILNNLKEDKEVNIVTIENSGVSKARNIGIKYANGEYIIPLDGDDKLDKSYVQKCLSVFNNNPTADIVYSNTRLFDGVNRIFGLSKFTKKGMLKKNCVVCTAMYRKSDFNKSCGYRENMVHGLEDWDFWLQMIGLNKKFYCINETLFFYRVKKESRNTQIKFDYEKQLNTYSQLIENNKELYDINKINLSDIIPQNTLLYRLRQKIIELKNRFRIGFIYEVKNRVHYFFN